MKKLTLLSTSLFIFTSVGLTANAFADYQELKKSSMEAVKKPLHEAEDVSSDLVNGVGGGANEAVGAASHSINSVGQYIKDGFNKVTNRNKK